MGWNGPLPVTLSLIPGILTLSISTQPAWASTSAALAVQPRRRPPPPPAGQRRFADQWRFPTGWTIWGEGLTYHTQGELCLYFGQPAANLWDLGVDQHGFALEQGKRYRLRMQLWSQSAATIKPIIGKSQPPWVNYWNQLSDLPADQVQTYSYDFTMNERSDPNAGLLIHVGGHNSKVLYR